ncbi:helix-turn-helix domain-containing protein [Sediminibacillus massiliensis]|uniref:helix-turn-helix domain-containing protein n=1 Tax=Sediminibacillus massiliensis TaxID=1926277 RepID=UPI00098835A2
MSFSKRLRKLREERGLSQEELAKKLNMPRTSVSHYENGESDRVPRQKRLYDLADFFGVTVDYLLGRSDSDKTTSSEEEFINDTKELSVEELMEKYRLNIDGEEASKEEIEGAIAFIRSLRGMK